MLSELKHICRGLAASRTFTAVAVLSLAIGIGANASIFSVIRTLLLDNMAVPRPGELALVYWHHPGSMQISQNNSSGGTDPATGLSLRSNYSYPIYESLIANAPAGVEAFGFNFLRDATVAFDQSATLAGGMAVDAGYFRVLSPRMLLGRGIGEADNRDDAPPVVVLSYPFFMRVFGGDAAVLGRNIRVNGVPAEIIGVTAGEFRGLSKGGFFPQTEVTVPLRQMHRVQREWASSGSLYAAERLFWVRVMARFPAGANREEAESRWAGQIAPRVAPFVTEKPGDPRVILRPGGQGLDQTRPETRRLLYVLMGVVGVVLLIACMNLAGLMLARGAARQRELNLRRALGAPRWRLIRTQLIEGVVLALAGAAGGLFLTFLGRQILTTLLTAGLGTAPMSRQPLEVSVDGPLIAATIALGLFVALAFSLLPAVKLTRSDAVPDLKQQIVGSAAPKLTLGRALVAIQVAITVPLLVCAVLFLRTVANLGAVDLGFNPEGLAYFKVNPATLSPELREQSQTYVRVLEAARAVPGVRSATLVENALLSGITSNTRITVNGAQQEVWVNAVGPDFVETMGLRLVAGRMPGLQDGPGAPRVGVLNETAARRFFGNESALGRVLTFPNSSIEIVGVISDALYDRQRAAVRPTLYPSALQRSGYGGHQVVVSTTVPIAQVDTQLRAAVASVSRDLPVPEIKTQIAQMREMTMRERVFAQLLTVFGGFALLLACIGLHGVTSYSVARRTNEIGVRMALGAAPGQVLRMILRQVAILAAVGLAVGVPVALWVAPLFGTLLFGVTPSDPAVIATGATTMLVVALLAGWLPARRASRLDPLKALRAE